MIQQIWYSWKRWATNFSNDIDSLLCVFAYVSPNLIYAKIPRHTLHKNIASLLCLFAYDSPNVIFEQTKSPKSHKNLAFLLCVFGYDSLKLINMKMPSQFSQEYGFSPVYVRIWFFKVDLRIQMYIPDLALSSWMTIKSSWT